MRLLPANLDRSNAVIAGLVWLAALITYVLTQAPTLSLWDCGEFIATSYILGIPHPPGTPTYVMFGRIASLIPTFTDICARINFLSGLCSSLAAMFSYLFGVRMLRYWFTDQSSLYNRILIYAGAASGALFLAFSRTQWGNSVEAEVYGMSMLLVFAIAWLTLVYFENRDTIKGNKVVLLIVYLAFLGIGVHMSTFIVFPISLIILILKRDTPAKYWFLVAAFFAFELFLIFALSSRPDEVPYYFPIALAGLFYLFYMLSFDRIAWQLVAVAGGFLIACVPAIASLAGSPGSHWDFIGVIGYVGLIGFGSFLIVGHFRAKRAATLESHGSLVAGIFVLVSAVMTAITQVGLENGPEGYKTFLFLTVALAIGIGVLIWRHVNLPVLIALAGPAMIVLGVREFFWGTLVALVMVVVLGLAFKLTGWKTAVLILIMAMAGWSTHLFAPIRSSLAPYINENNPAESRTATINFFERKQYGSQSMTERMFQRRGEWSNQFGDYRRMGFWYFFKEQYGVDGWGFVALLLLGVFGAWEACRRKPEVGLYMVVLMLVTSVGLVLYMNFADGARQTAYDAWLEVRDRDYFFTPAFMFFGLSIGLGISAVIMLLRDLTQKFSAVPRSMVMTSSLVLFLLPVYALANNYYYCDRSKNYIPYDYARNILESCDQNAILFTYGDNDTFPLWCLQEVYGVRKDVKTICCSLANGVWYIKQIQHYMGVETGWTDAQIDSLRPYRTNDGGVFRIQDQVVDAVTTNNFGKRPINFSLLASPSARKLYGVRIDSLMAMNGPIYRLTDTSTSGDVRIPTDVNAELLMTSGRLQYRGWTDPDIYRCETSRRSIAGFADKFLATAEVMLRENKVDEAVETMQFVIDSIYADSRAIEALAAILAEQGDTGRLLTFREEHPGIDVLEYQMILARAYFQAGDRPTSTALLLQLLAAHPNHRRALDEVMQIYIAERDIDAMVFVLETWVRYNPGDLDVAEALRQLQAQLEEARPPGGDSS